MIAGGLIGLLLVAGGAWAGLRHRGAQPAAPAGAGGLDPHRVAVLYFQDLDPRDSLKYLAEGLTEGLIRQLSEVQTLDVISPNGVAQYRGDSIPRDSVARALNVGTLVQGGVERTGDRVRVTVRLVDGSSGADYQRASFEQPAANVLGIQDSLVQQVAGLIRRRLGEEIKLREQRESTSSPQSWILVQRAEAARKEAEALVAQKDTTGAVARSFELADSIYASAAAADPKWIEPILGRGWVAFRRSRLVGLDPLAAKPWIAKGEKFAEEALAIGPQDPDACSSGASCATGAGC